MNIRKYLFALAAAFLVTALPARAGWDITQNADGSMCWQSNSVDAMCIDSSGNLNIQSGDLVDLQGVADSLVLDDDGDTSISSPTDDQIDIELGGVDHIVGIGVAAADSAATNNLFELALTSPVDTTGTNTHNALTIDLAIGNATGGTNAVRGLQIDSITGDAQVTETAVNVESGWDAGLAVDSPADFTYVQGADAAATGDALEIAFTSPVDTTGTNVHNALTIDLSIGNATGGTNSVTGIQIDNITGDAQVTETGVIVGTGFDVGVDLQGTRLDLDADNDTSIIVSTDDQIDVEVAGTNRLQVTGSTTHAYVLPQDATHGIQREVSAIFDDFVYQTIPEADTPWVLNSGTDAQAIDPAINLQVSGVIRVTTGDLDGTTAADASQLVAAVPALVNRGGLVFETRLHINTAITTVSVCAGLTDVTTLEEPFEIGASDAITSNATNAVAFCYDTGAATAEWFALGVDTDTDATGNAATGTAPVADVYQVLRIEVDSDGETARFYINGTLAVSLTASVSAINTNLYATVIANATTTTSRTVDVDYIYVGHTR